MDIKKLRQPVNQFLNALPKSVRVSQVILFGSQTTGRAKRDSDIDLFVISDDFNYLTEDRRLDLLHTATRKIEPDIDAWGFTPQELEKASQFSTLGYARDNGIYYKS